LFLLLLALVKLSSTGKGGLLKYEQKYVPCNLKILQRIENCATIILQIALSIEREYGLRDHILSERVKDMIASLKKIKH